VTEPDDRLAYRQIVSNLGRANIEVGIFSGRDMARLATKVPNLGVGTVIYDAHNVETTLFRSLSRHAGFVADPFFRERYTIERAEKIERVEATILALSNQVWAVSRDDATAFRSFGAVDVHVVPNVVSPGALRFGSYWGLHRLLFLGRLDYLPNVEAVEYFSKELASAIRQQFPELRIVIAGANPGDHLRHLCRHAGMEIAADISETDLHRLQRESILVVPLRVGGGSRVKILEAFCRRVPVIASAAAVAGIDGAVPHQHFYPAETTAEVLAGIDWFLRFPTAAQELLNAARELILRCFTIDAMRQTTVRALSTLIVQPPAKRSPQGEELERRVPGEHHASPEIPQLTPESGDLPN
jgi:glycosyltransferase involved in cell wall biosynthesis